MAARRKTVLVCDDDSQMADVLKATLDRLGYDSDVRTDCTESLKAFSDNPDAYDMAILDRSMPQMTGDELAHKLSSIRPGLPVVLLSGTGLVTEDEPLPAGVTEMHEKPLTRSDLSALLDRLIGRE